MMQIHVQGVPIEPGEDPDHMLECSVCGPLLVVTADECEPAAMRHLRQHGSTENFEEPL